MAKRVMQKRSLVTLRDGFYHTNFRINGRRIRQSLGTSDKAQAEIIAAKIYSDALLGKLTGKLPELTLSLALSRYYSEHGQYLRAASDMLRWGEELQVGLGKKTLLRICARRNWQPTRRAAGSGWRIGRSISNCSICARSSTGRATFRRSRRQRSTGKRSCWRRPASASMC